MTTEPRTAEPSTVEPSTAEPSTTEPVAAERCATVPPLRDLLEHVLGGEPTPADEVDAVFRRADALRRRRTRLLLAAGAMIAGTVVLAGYVLTATLLPVRRTPQISSAGVGSAVAQPSPPAPSAVPVPVPVPSAIADQVLAVVAPAVDAGRLRIVPREPSRGFGWRQYSVLTVAGRPRGTVEVAVYARPDGLCFPRRDGRPGCAPVDHATAGIDYVRYHDDDPGWQVNQTIARRVADGRTVALMATGERDAGDAADGQPALSGSQIQRLATDPGLMAAFGPTERCDGEQAEACPIFKVPVPSA